jgi:hypothetical protein
MKGGDRVFSKSGEVMEWESGWVGQYEEGEEESWWWRFERIIEEVEKR